jgi:hypothetical protein
MWRRLQRSNALTATQAQRLGMFAQRLRQEQPRRTWLMLGGFGAW